MTNSSGQSRLADAPALTKIVRQARAHAGVVGDPFVAVEARVLLRLEQGEEASPGLQDPEHLGERLHNALLGAVVESLPGHHCGDALVRDRQFGTVRDREPGSGALTLRPFPSLPDRHRREIEPQRPDAAAGHVQRVTSSATAVVEHEPADELGPVALDEGDDALVGPALDRLAVELVVEADGVSLDAQSEDLSSTSAKRSSCSSSRAPAAAAHAATSARLAVGVASSASSRATMASVSCRDSSG